MKTIYLIRHAKSSWSNPTLMDKERLLNERGKRDAPFMAQKLKEMSHKIDLLVSSPAKRALKTANEFSNAIFGSKKVEIEEDLYHASEDDIVDVINGLDDKYESVALFGHNPGFTYLANSVSDVFIDNVPTCGIVHFQFDGKLWSDLDLGKCKMINFIYPKYYKS